MSLAMVTQEVLADFETPVSAYAKICRGRPDSMLLESVESHETVGRFSIIAADPIHGLTLWPDRLEVRSAGREAIGPIRDFFPQIQAALDTLTIDGPATHLASVASPGPEPRLPAVGSLMGYVGYDAVRLVENLGPLRASGQPTARLVFPSRFVIFDQRRRMMTLVGLDRDPAQARAKVAETRELLDRNLRLPFPLARVEMEAPSRERYMAAVERAREYIRAGDIFQVVLADRFQGATDVDPLNFYRCLRVRSPSPYMFFLDFGDFQIAGASPETLVKVRDGLVTLRPIAGTRGRSEDPVRDQALEKELLDSEKERAEHIMLVDLARNDAGRVAVSGSVRVEPYMTVERYSHVMHIVSAVQGRLRPEAGIVEAFTAGFPAGTVSGAPKVRAMQIIDELESGPRGPYSGAVGYFGPGRETDTCIAIRQVLFEPGRFTIPVGAGIVADSDPAFEYQEIGHKAAQSLAALKTAAGGGI